MEPPKCGKILLLLLVEIKILEPFGTLGVFLTIGSPGSKMSISTNSSSRSLPHLGGSKIVTPTIYIILPSWNHSIVKIMFKVLKILISSSWVNGQYMAEVQRLCVLMEKLSSIYQIKSWYLLWEKICTFYLLNGLLCSQHDPQKLELDEGSHNTLILLLCQCMSCYIQCHLSAYWQTRNVPVRVELQERYACAGIGNMKPFLIKRSIY